MKNYSIEEMEVILKKLNKTIEEMEQILEEHEKWLNSINK